ncbi:MAG: UDP-glucose/GDP-mannose dehydrogenase family protein, partial [Candidatus Micrarchaeota archaeon]|nr:UDP-glucose/GDP-mannose dehydrogenase family protein [Candidatus Micrarchaeota archaeon]
MKIAIIGLGYVGQVSAIALAAQGHDVLGVDVDKSKVESLIKGVPTIHEPKLKELLEKNKSNIRFSTSYEGLADVEVAIISVPTPTVKGKADLGYVKEACRSAIAANSKITLVIKSTVVPGTAKEIEREIGAKVVSNPEFTQEGSALEDTLHPDRTVIGSSEERAAGIVEKLWSFTGAPTIKTTNENAEMIKYASNAFLATKISFINEVADLCEKIPGGDVEVVAKGMGLDKRIAPRFLKAGIGYGGSCLPKDTQALVSFAKERGVS